MEDYNSWSTDFENIVQWVENLISTDGFIKAVGLKPKKINIELNQT